MIYDSYETSTRVKFILYIDVSREETLLLLETISNFIQPDSTRQSEIFTILRTTINSELITRTIFG